jgi:peptidoglycan/LPS O-acetylase OafA/YrhL
MPQLDGLRCLAASAVLVWHFAPADAALNAAFAWGDAGVQLFFVLSGFLVTAIVLRSASAGGADRSLAGVTLRRFYVRRCLRIVPLYYGVLAVLLVLGVAPARDGVLWHLTYTTNFYLAWLGEWPDHVFHFWTLAVEEQFYLLWPALLCFGPRRWLVPCCLLGMATAPLYRLAATVAGCAETVIYVLPPANVDTLAAGSLLAVLDHDPARARARALLTRAGPVVGLPLLIVAVLLRNAGAPPLWHDSLWRGALVLFYPWLVFGAARGFTGPAGALLSLRPIVYLGRISYGIYVYHVLAVPAVGWTLARAGLAPVPPGGEVVLWTLATLVVCALSWHLVEAPIARQRRRFPYPWAAEASAAGVGAVARVSGR